MMRTHAYAYDSDMTCVSTDTRHRLDVSV